VTAELVDILSAADSTKAVKEVSERSEIQHCFSWTSSIMSHNGPMVRKTNFGMTAGPATPDSHGSYTGPMYCSMYCQLGHCC